MLNVVPPNVSKQSPVIAALHSPSPAGLEGQFVVGS